MNGGASLRLQSDDAASVMEMMSGTDAHRQEIGWAVVGTGQVSRFLSSDLGQLPEARRLAVASRDMHRAEEFASQEGFERAYGSLETLLDQSDVDIVYIATPHATHSRIAVAALEAGKHVLVEKPFGVDAADATRIVDAARRNGRFAMEAMWMRFNPAYRSLLAEVAAGDLGQPMAVRATFGLPLAGLTSDQWSAIRRSSTLLDQGIYAVTLARDVLGEPLSVAAGAHVREDDVDLTVEATLTFPGGRFAQLAASMVAYLEPSASVSGTEGWATLAAPFWATDRYSLRVGGIPEALFGAESERTFERTGYGYVPMLEQVQDALSCGWLEHPWHSLDESVATAEVLDRIRSSWTVTSVPSRNSPQGAAE